MNALLTFFSYSMILAGLMLVGYLLMTLMDDGDGND